MVSGADFFSIKTQRIVKVYKKNVSDRLSEQFSIFCVEFFFGWDFLVICGRRRWSVVWRPWWISIHLWCLSAFGKGACVSWVNNRASKLIRIYKGDLLSELRRGMIWVFTCRHEYHSHLTMINGCSNVVQVFWPWVSEVPVDPPCYHEHLAGGFVWNQFILP